MLHIYINILEEMMQITYVPLIKLPPHFNHSFLIPVVLSALQISPFAPAAGVWASKETLPLPTLAL
jgi:hypothetical protein